MTIIILDTRLGRVLYYGQMLIKECSYAQTQETAIRV